MERGVLPDWRMKELIADGVIVGADENLVNTSSLDLRVSPDKWKLVGSFLPLPGQSVQEALTSKHIVDIASRKPDFYIENGQPYLMKLMESLNLPKTISAKIFNKSGRARVGVELRTLTEWASHFDVVPGGYKGDLYAEISATAFPLVIDPGIAMPQIRFYEGNPEPLMGSRLERLLDKHPILTDDKGKPAYTEQEREEMIRTGKLTFTADLSQEGLLAYIAKRDNRAFDLSKKGFYLPEDYFQKIVPEKGNGSMLTIHHDDFVLIKSKQHIRLPPSVCAEIDPYTSELGDMKASYANVINATHGWGSIEPSYIVFEIQARKIPRTIQDNQPCLKFSLYDMLGEPKGRYMEKKSTNYGDLKSILPKEFKKD